MPIVSEKPLIEILSPEDQHDRFDINYYLPEFIHAERYIENCDIELTTLGDVMTDDASYGVLPPSSSYLEEGGISLVRSSNVSNSGVDYESAVRVPSEWINSERARIKSNDVLISIKGARAFFDMCVASDNPPDAIVNGSIFRFQCKEDFDPKFVVLWLLSEPIQSLVFRERANLGISYISSEVLSSIPFPKLSMQEQRNILIAHAQCIKSLDLFGDQIGGLENKIRESSSDLSKVFSDALELSPIQKPVEKRVFLSRQDRSVERLDVKGNQESLFNMVAELKTNANFRSLNTIADYINNGAASREYCDSEDDGARRYLLVADVKNGKLTDDKPAFVSSTSYSRKLSNELLLFTRKGTVGEVAIPTEEHADFIPCSEIMLIGLSSTSNAGRELIRVFLLTEYGRLQVFYNCSGGQMPSISQDRVGDIMLPHLPEEQCESILSRCRVIFDKTENINREKLDVINKRSELMDALSSDLLGLLGPDFVENYQKQVKEALQ
ncbi:hypothetical protein [Aeromonas veronii]|uniref:hypothetical protein n=1 Tax=Aeromonas veronii TaxID=654 RepID=UPI003F66487A